MKIPRWKMYSSACMMRWWSCRDDEYGRKKVMCEEKKKVIQAFNEKCYENLKDIMKELGAGVKTSIYCLSFDVDGSKITPIITEGQNINKHSENFLAYYWAEFKKEKEEYRLTMFFKDFDHGTGNIHVLPGLFQFWIKKDSGDDYFKIGKERTDDIKIEDKKFEFPHGKHGGGRVYAEYANDNKIWVPCVVNKYPYARVFYNVIAKSDCAKCVGEKLKNSFNDVIKDTEAFKYECKKATESNLVYTDELKKAIYRTPKSNDWGRATYCLLKWNNLDENEEGVKRDKAIKMKPFYNIKYVDTEEIKGYFYVFGPSQELETYDLNYSKTGINVVWDVENEEKAESSEQFKCPKNYYWEFKYK